MMNFNFKGSLLKCWAAGGNKRALPNIIAIEHIENFDISKACKEVVKSYDLAANNYVGLRVSGQLTYGIARIYKYQVNSLLEDTNAMMKAMSTFYKTFNFLIGNKERKPRKEKYSAGSINFGLLLQEIDDVLSTKSSIEDALFLDIRDRNLLIEIPHQEEEGADEELFGPMTLDDQNNFLELCEKRIGKPAKNQLRVFTENVQHEEFINQELSVYNERCEKITTAIPIIQEFENPIDEIPVERNLYYEQITTTQQKRLQNSSKKRILKVDTKIKLTVDEMTTQINDFSSTMRCLVVRDDTVSIKKMRIQPATQLLKSPCRRLPQGIHEVFQRKVTLLQESIKVVCQKPNKTLAKQSRSNLQCIGTGFVKEYSTFEEESPLELNNPEMDEGPIDDNYATQSVQVNETLSKLHCLWQSGVKPINLQALCINGSTRMEAALIFHSLLVLQSKGKIKFEKDTETNVIRHIVKN